MGDLILVLVEPRNPLNIGAVARAMSNFGASDLRIANTYRQDFRDAASAVGLSSALLHAATEYATLAEALHDASFVVGTTGAIRPGFAQPLELLEPAAGSIRTASDAGQRVALVFGTEKYGLSNDDMSLCHLLLRIPTRDEHASMNLGQAAALCLYELARVPSAEPLRPSPAAVAGAATAGDLERLTALLAEALAASEYKGLQAGQRSQGLQSALRRLSLSSADAHMAMGFLRQILWKLRGRDPSGT